MPSLMDKSLPKWPQMMLVGEPVTRDQALEIILRTDPFLYGDGHTNYRDFEKRFYRLTGLDQGFVYDYGQTVEDGFFYRLGLMEDALNARMGRIPLEYLVSQWTACSFIYGPHGFCSPSGELFFQDNIGKHPSVEEVYSDFVRIAEAFPFLDFKASLYTDDRALSALVSFVVQDGKVTVNEDDYDLQQYRRPQANRPLLSDRDEVGVPEDMLDDIIARLRAATEYVLTNPPAMD